ncbi:hypothetical protein GIB67_038116, partial [Kingdonia uniflora]
SIPRVELSESISTYQYSLIGRLDLQKIKLVTIQAYARTNWKIKGTCKLIPIGKGFFIIKLESEEDKIYIWSRGPWMVEQMPMRLIPWNPFFSVDRHCNSNALIWCKFPGLPIEMWSKKIIMSLRKTLGTPIQLDHATRNQDYEYHADMLVDIDLSKPIPDHILLEVEGNIIKQEVLLH